MISAARNAEDAKELEYAYRYEDIGNRIPSFDLGTNRTYIANNLNQYTQISNLCDSASPMRTFVNMQNRFGDFRINPGCLM